MVESLITLLAVRLGALRADERGQTFIEYALVLVVLAVAIVALTQLTGVASAIGGALDKVTSKL